MFINETLNTVTYDLSDSEALYRDIYNANLSLGKIFNVIRNSGKDKNSLWLPGINTFQNRYDIQSLTEKVVGLTLSPVQSCLHARYLPLYLHRHEFYEIIFVVRGTCSNIVEGNAITMSEYDISILSPYVSHMIGVFDNSIVLNILFTKKLYKEVMTPFLKRVKGGLYIIDCLNTVTVSNLSIADNLYARQMLEDIYAENFINDKQSINIKIAALLAFFASIAKGTISSESYTYTKSDRVEKILYYMQKNYRDATLKSVAEFFNYSPTYLSSLLKSNTGLGFTEILRSIRMIQVCYHLLCSVMPVSDIADIAGYSDTAYFSKLFKEFSGMSPSEYRNYFKSLTWITPVLG